jgi:hypothetical protein
MAAEIEIGNRASSASGVRADAGGKVADSAALAGWAGELGKFSGSSQMAARFVPLTSDVEGGGHVASQSGLCTREAAVHCV